MPKALLHTDIFSEILKGIDQVVVRRATDYRAAFGRYTISAITVMEVVKGLHKVSREDRIQQFLKGLTTVELLSLDGRSAEPGGTDLRRSGAHGAADWTR